MTAFTDDSTLLLSRQSSRFANVNVQQRRRHEHPVTQQQQQFHSERRKGTNNDSVILVIEDEPKPKTKQNRISRESTRSIDSKIIPRNMLNDYDKEEEEEEEEEGYLNGNGSDGDQLIPSYNKHHNIPTLNSDRSSNSSSSSSHSKRRYLEPEDVDSIYGDYLNNDEGSTSKNPFVIDSVSDRTSNNSSVSINKRRRTSENTRPLPPIEQPKRSQRQQPHYEEKNKDDHEEEDDDYDDVSEEKYEVEEILAHKVYRNRVVKYEIKWVGYSNKHNTWEPASSVHEDCPKICAKYWSKHEPRPINAPTNSTSKQPQQQQHKKSDASNKQESYIKRLENHNITDEDLHVSLKNQGFHIAYGSGFPTKSTDWMLEMRQIHLVQKVEGTDQILAYVSWANRKKTVHVVQELHDKCPGELISYYEARIRFED